MSSPKTPPADDTPDKPTAAGHLQPDDAPTPAGTGAPKPPLHDAPRAVLSPIGRIPVTNVAPVIEGGAYPAKAVVGEAFPVTANVFREGHDSVNATVVLTGPDGAEHAYPMTQQWPLGLDIWQAWVRPDAQGDWTFRVEGWSDPWGTWHHHAEAKLPVDVDVELVCMEGVELFGRAATNADEAGDRVSAAVLRAAAAMLLPEREASELLETVNASGVAKAMAKYVPRELVSPTREYPLYVDRTRALYSSWYEFFPRSEGATYDEATDTWTSGTFDTAIPRLEAAAAMGFDVVYLPPIHPIGTQFKKGKNNTLDATEKDPGSPWAIGNTAGGHDAIHPDLGDFESFDRFVAKAKELGLEIALDFALQASPDHPWATEHPEWFTTRLDGTIAYAENPPKKYQDIYPINFDNDPEGIYHEALRILKLWMSHGVTIFRVDNPHTKSLAFWDWLMSEVRAIDPDVLFLAEAFTRPQMMHALGKVGYHQSYTYFTWRNEKWELEEYMGELKEWAPFYRPNFFVNTPDINPSFLHSGAPSAFTIRAVLAATLSPTWGVYAGFELCEHEPVSPGREEYLNSEKYEYRPRDYDAPGNLNMLLGQLNAIRANHPALQQLRSIDFHTAENRNVIAYSKADRGDTVIVVCSLDPHNVVESQVYLDFEKLSVPGDRLLRVRDELTGAQFTWGQANFVRLSPSNPCHVLTIQN